MNRILSAALATSLLIASLPFGANAANDPCGRALSAEGRATRVEGSSDFKRYNGHVPADLARLRAISAWQGRVADLCPRYSAIWRRAVNAHVDCDAGMGHDTCIATATPRRKLLSWILPR